MSSYLVPRASLFTETVGTIYVGVYCRISKDSEKKGKGVDRQLSVCRDLCDTLSWVIRPENIFVDNDISAAKGRDGTLKARPEYNRMLTLFGPGEGHIQAVASFDMDRLTRTLLEMEQFFAAALTLRMHRLRTGEDDVHINDGRGMLTAQIKATFAQEEVRKMRKRGELKQNELADQGKWHGGPRPFGFNPPDKSAIPPVLTWSVVPEEAAAIRDGAKRVLAGESLFSVAKAWNGQRLRTTFGNEWSTRGLQRVLLASRLAGLREHHRGGELLTRTEAEWPAVISVADHERLVHLLTDPARASARPIKSYLLTGLVRCGHCDSKMGAGITNGRRGYLCKKAPGYPGCGRMAAMSVHVDDFVTKVVLARFAQSPATREALRGPQTNEDDEAVNEIQLCDDRIKEAAAAWANGEITMAGWSEAERQLLAKREAARRTLGQRRRVDALHGIDDPVQQWPTLSLDRQHALLSALIERIVILPAKGGPTFDNDRVDIRWSI